MPSRQKTTDPSIRMDDEFAELLPPLREGELRGLEADIRANGCLMPLIVWNGILVDGYQRYSICRQHGVPFEVRQMRFASRDEALLWAWNQQKNRRNISPYVRVERALRFKPYVEARAKAKQRASGGAVIQNSGEPPLRTDKELARIANVSHDTIARVEYIRNRADEQVKRKLRDGETTIHREYTRLRRLQQQEENEALKARNPAAPGGEYDVVVLDPPWPMRKIERDCRPNQADFDYPTMSEDELAALDIPGAPRCHLFVWTTQRFLPMAMRLLPAWGFKYVCSFVWHKPGGFQPVGLPQYNCEFALYARKGSPRFVDTRAFSTCFQAPRGRHSEKPQEFYELVRRVTEGRRIDMFSRRRISGFDAWGNEA